MPRNKPDGYTFVVKPDKSMWVLRLPDGRRLMGQGNPYTDRTFSRWLNRLDKRKTSKILRPLMRKNKLQGEPVLLDCTQSGFRFVEGDVSKEIELIRSLTQQLIDIYKIKHTDYDKVS